MTTSPVMGITEELLAELEEKAKAATPGPFLVEGTTVYVLNDDGVNRIWAQFQPGWAGFKTRTSEAECVATAQLSAAANPTAILALIAHIRSLEARLKESTSALSRIADRAGAYIDDERDMPCEGLMRELAVRLCHSDNYTRQMARRELRTLLNRR